MLVIQVHVHASTMADGMVSVSAIMPHTCIYMYSHYLSEHLQALSSKIHSY